MIHYKTRLEKAIEDYRAWQRCHGRYEDGARLKAIINRLQREAKP